MNLVRGNWSPLLARFNNLDFWKALEIRWKLFGEQAWKALEVRWKLFGEQSWHNSHTPSSGNRSADFDGFLWISMDLERDRAADSLGVKKR